MRQREWMRCTDSVEMLRAASFAMHVPSESDLAAMRRRRRSGGTLLEYPHESEAARARRRFQMFTLTAAQPALNRVDNAVCHAAAEIGWRVAERTASAEEIAKAQETLRAAYEACIDAVRVHFVTPDDACLLPRLINVLALLFNEPYGAALTLIVPQSFFASAGPVPLLTPEETGGCCSLIREVFGLHRGEKAPYWQPFWATDTVVSLARQMYDSREFSAMPILADALQDAGCDNEDVLNHCRDTALTHVRGCWVVDLVLR